MDKSARAAFTELLPPAHEFPETDAERSFALIDDPAVSMLLAEEDGDLLGVSTCARAATTTPTPRLARSAACSWPPGTGARAPAAR